MKKPLLFLLFLLLINICFVNCQSHKNTHTVINMLGAKVYEKATFNSKVISTLKVGKIVILEDFIETSEEFEIGANFSLTGKWIKPNGIDGFIFSSDLTNKKVEVIKSNEGRIQINLKGKLINEKKEIKKFKNEQGEFPKHFEYKNYENGNYIKESWDGCFNHRTEYNSLNINEVYHQVVSSYGLWSDSKEYWVPQFKQKSKNIINFEGEGATEDLKIKIKEDGVIIVTSYDCT